MSYFLGVMRYNKNPNETITIPSKEAGVALITMDTNGETHIVPIKYFLLFSETFTYNTYYVTIERSSNGGNITVSGNCRVFVTAILYV